MSDSIVLCYHAVSPTWTAPLSVTPEALERQLSWLVRRGWRATTFAGAVLEPPAARTLSVTFDDAFASVLSLALPILGDLGLPATVFAPTAFMSARGTLSWPGIDHWGDTAHAAELACMSWEELGLLAERGWEIGSHSRTHPHLTRIDDQALRTELADSREEVLTQLGLPCATIAYPYGDVDERVASAAGAAGYRFGAALSSRLTPAGLLRWPRVGVYNADTWGRFRLKTSRTMRRVRASPLWART
jgi:peptidoglycan/xylan/chitin deacetylase (PgdA/CDA1 family)